MSTLLFVGFSLANVPDIFFATILSEDDEINHLFLDYKQLVKVAIKSWSETVILFSKTVMTITVAWNCIISVLSLIRQN